MQNQALSAITGLGFSRLSREPIGSPRSLALSAMRAAVIDSGLGLSEIDGLLLNQSAQISGDAVPLKLRQDLGLGDIRLHASIDSKGASVIQMLQMATLAIRHGMANAVLCVFSDTPVGSDSNSGASYVNASALTGIEGWDQQYGLIGAVANYAMAAQRYMSHYGSDERHLGAYAISCRNWALHNPMAQQREPLSFEQYLASRFIVEPFRILDCALPINGAAAFIVTDAVRARTGVRPPVYIHGMGQCHGSTDQWAHDREEITAGARSASASLQMAGIAPAAVTCCQIYDPFSICAFVALEDFGLCKKGEAPDFVLDGQTGPGGTMPVSTGGGHLSGYYLQGMTPIAEAIIQARGDGGERQVAANDVILVNGSGGLFEHHATVVLSPRRSLA